MTSVRLGKITWATFGLGGYQDCQIGFWLRMGGDGWGVEACGGGAWACAPTNSCRWTEADRDKQLASAAMLLAETLMQAKKLAVQDLVCVPVECTFEGNTLKGWRVLLEVL